MAYGHQVQRSRYEESDGGGDVAPGRRTLTMAMPGRASAPPIQFQLDLGAALAEAAPPSRFPADDPFGMHLIGDHLPAAGDGEALPAPVQAKMERSFGTDLSDVRVHQDGRAAAMGAVAYTQGTDVHFSPGAYDPGSASGQELLGHELAHVVQQRAGVVRGTQAKGGRSINADVALEQEADREGARAARGETATIAGAGGGGGQLRGEQHAIQGVWWVVRDLGVGILEGFTREAAQQVTREQLGRVIADAAPGLLAAIDAAMQNAELRQMLGNLRLLHNAGEAARALATQHARQMAQDLAAWLREQMPSLPEDLIPEAVRDLQARIEARMRNSYAAEAVRAIADVGSQMAAAAASAHLGQVIDRQLVRAAASGVSSAAHAAVAPVMEAAGGAVETAQQVQQVIRDAELPVPPIFRPINRLGRAIGRRLEHVVTGTTEASATIDGSVMDPLRQTAAAGQQHAQQQAAAAVTAPSAVDPATVLRVAQATQQFAQADRTADRVSALAAPAVDTGMGMLGGAALAAPLAAVLPVAAAPLIPAMAAAGGVALGQRYVMPAVRSAAEAAAPHLEAFGQTTVGTPFRKAAQGVHTAASFLNVGMTTLMAPLPFVGGGWAGIEAAVASTDRSVDALMGNSPAAAPPVAAPAPVVDEDLEAPPAAAVEEAAPVSAAAAAAAAPAPMRPFVHPSLRGLYGMNPMMMGMPMGMRRPMFNPLMMPMYNPILAQASLARMGIAMPGMPAFAPVAEQPAAAPAPAPAVADPAEEAALQARLAALMAPAQAEAQPQAAPPAPADPEMDELEMRMARLNAPAVADPETAALEARLARLQAPAEAPAEREAHPLGAAPDPDDLDLLQAQLAAPDTDDPEIAALEARLGALQGPAPTEDDLELRLANLNAPPVTDPEIMALEARLMRLQQSPAEAAEMDELEARLARLNAPAAAPRERERERVAITVPRS